MEYGKQQCANLNHSRPHPPIKFCPTCGVRFGNSAPAHCDVVKHSVRRKDRDHFCIDCGLSLKK